MMNSNTNPKQDQQGSEKSEQKNPKANANDQNNSSGNQNQGRQNNNNGRRRQQNNGNQQRIPKFQGLNKDELEGIVICENINTPLAQQFDALYEALMVYGGSRNGKIKTAIRTMEDLKPSSFQPPKPEESSYITEDGVIDEDVKKVRFNAWEKGLEQADKLYRKYAEAMENLFNTIIGQLGPEIKSSLKGLKTWEEIDMSNQTIKLLRELKTICYRDNSSKVDPGIDVIRKLRKVMVSKQHDQSKTAVAYVEETVNKADVLKSAGVIITSPELIKYTLANVMNGRVTYDEYLQMWGSNDIKTRKLKDHIDECVRQILISRIIIEGSNDKAHQNLRLELEKDFAKGQDNYPNNVTSTLDLLNQYRVRNQGTRNQTGGHAGNTGRNNNNKGGNHDNRGSNDNQAGQGSVQRAHQMLMNSREIDEASDDDDDSLRNFLFFQHSDTSHNSDEQQFDGNIEREPERTDLNDFLTFNHPGKNEKHSEAKAPERQDVETNTKQGKAQDGPIDIVNVTNAYQFAQRETDRINPYWILLDSQASCHVIFNKHMLRNIRSHPTGKRVVITCNAGNVELNTVGNLPGVGMVWYAEHGIANILSLALISDQFRVTLDTGIDQAFYVHKPDGTTRRFERVDCDLYACDTKAKQEHLFITTVEGQKESYSELDCRRAKAARTLQEIIGFPSTRAFIKMIDSNTIKNCPVTRRDIKMALDIYGPNPNMVKGKTVRQRRSHIREDDIQPVPSAILKNYGSVTLAVDIYYINGCRILRTISRHLMFRTSIPLANAKTDTLFKRIKAVVGLYQIRGFNVNQIHGDNEFSKIEDRLANDPELKISFYPCTRDSHVPAIERDNRTSKERCRCICAGLPFKKMPKRMIMQLPVAVDFWLNYWCSSGGVSKTIPPREIMTGIRLDAGKHCRFQFGDYVLAHEETDNTMKPRATDCIYLHPTGTPDGAFMVLNLRTGQKVRRYSGTLAHMTDTIINRVEEIAECENMPSGITFTDNNDVTIYDIETESIASADDDDDASDESYTTADNESTGSTDAEGDTWEENMATNKNGATADTSRQVNTPLIQEAETQECEQAQECEQTQECERHVPEGHGVDPGEDEGFIGSGDDGEETIVFEGADTEEHVEITHPRIDDTDQEDKDVDGAEDRSEERSANAESDAQDSIDTDGPTGTETMEPTERRMRLREPKPRTHNKFYGMEGEKRYNFFTGGLSKALKELEKTEAKYMLVAAAVEQYNKLDASQVTPQYGAERGIKEFGEDGTDAIMKELRQLHDMHVISPIHPRDMTKEEIKRALPYLMFLKRKRCGKIKGRGCADGRSQREFISKEEASSPTASLYAIILTGMVDAIERRYVVTTDIPGAFLQTDMPENEIVHLRIQGSMARLLEMMYPETYGKCIITTKRGKKILFAKANKAIYGTLRAALLFWESLKSQLEEWGFEQNPYDPCTMNKMVNGKQLTIVWHVDDLKISHVEKEVVEDVLNRLNAQFGKTSPLSTTRGSVHDYLGMTLDYSLEGRLRISMYDYLQEIIQNMPDELVSGRNCTSPAADHLFSVNGEAVKLCKKRSETFHKYVAKLLFAAKRARPDIQTAIAFLCTRVQSPDEDDWKKLVRVLGYLKETIFLPLTLGWDGTGNIYWYVDASFAVHHNMRSHTGAMMTFGQGAALSMSTKQKINTKSSTEAELVGVDDALPFNIWCMYFLKEQGYCEKASGHDQNGGYLGHTNVLYQDNTSSIKLETNGKASSTKRTRHINIRYFLITDKIKRGEVSTVEYCPTEEMVADYFTKPLQGAQFRKLRNAVMGCTDAEYIELKLSFEKARNNNNDM